MSEPTSDFEMQVRSGEDLGHDVYIKREYALPDGGVVAYPEIAVIPDGAVFIGIMENHKNPAGKWCGGWVGFTNVPEAVEVYTRLTGKPPVHELVTARPLTVSPSLLCRTCEHHGFIHEQTWVPA